MPTVKYKSDWAGGKFLLGKEDISEQPLDEVVVIWPDLSESKEKVYYKVVHGQDNDMSHAYGWTKKVPYLKVNHHGVTTEVDIVGLKIKSHSFRSEKTKTNE